MARTALMSPAHFSRRFRAAYGQTSHGYLIIRRIKRAMVVLRAGVSVADACMAVGCTSLASFSSRFAEVVGETPTTYRNHGHDGPGHARLCGKGARAPGPERIEPESEKRPVPATSILPAKLTDLLAHLGPEPSRDNCRRRVDTALSLRLRPIRADDEEHYLGIHRRPSVPLPDLADPEVAARMVALPHGESKEHCTGSSSRRPFSSRVWRGGPT